MTRKINATADKAKYTKGNSMKDKNYTPPEFEKEAFHCPHCGTFAHQNWCDLYIKDGQNLSYFYNRRGEVYPENNFNASLCVSCEHYCVWLGDNMIYPDLSTAPLPNDDLPEKIMEIYKEAASVFSRSPRAAAALLRLAIEEICVHVKCEGKTLQEKVDYLVNENKISREIAQALDSVRIIGNEAIHPGTIDLQDNAEMVTIMFKLVNFVAERLITEPRQIQELHDSLPDSKKRKKMPNK